MPLPAAAVSGRTLVLGRYRPLKPLGSGGAGSVWLARDERNGRQVALKIVPREGTSGSRAEREAWAAARLRHPRCLRAYALARDPEHVYIAYEYVPGRTLRHAMREGELDDRKLLEAAAQIADGLAHAHAHGIVHRDIKPANVLLTDGTAVAVKILDFGLALIREEETLTAAGDIPGTLAYISPERLRGQTAGPPADIWSLGVLLWEGLGGRHPFWSGGLLETAQEIQSGASPLVTERADLPSGLLTLVDRCLSVEPKRRPPAAKVAAALRAAAGAQSRRRRPRLRPVVAPRRPSLKRIAPAPAAALFAGWTATALPFYPAGWWALLSAIAGLLSIASARSGLAFALLVPVFPLGNHSLGLALAYLAFAAIWLALSWREPRAGLFLALGPLLSPLAALGFLPVAAQLVRHPLRRLLGVTAAVLAAAAVTALDRLTELGIAGAASPAVSAEAVWRTLLAHPSALLLGLGLGISAVLLPFARNRGPWPVAGFGAAMLALTLLPVRDAPTFSLVAAAWATCALLALEPYALRGDRASGRLNARSERAAHDRAEDRGALRRRLRARV